MSTKSIRLGPFELLEPIARGGMAEVWRGAHLRQAIPVAIKVITSSRARQPEFLDAFKTEVQAVARLHHPSIVMIFDHGEVTQEAALASGDRLITGSPYLAMELASWGSLDRVRLPLKWDDLLRILLSLLDALAHAHARGVIHRDLKPGNILLSSHQDVRPGLKLTDFGIAHALEQESRPGAAEASSGTPHFMAPEQFLGLWRDYGPWTDLYALGCVAHMLTTGRLPFEAENPLQLAWAHVNSPPPRLTHNPELPPAFETWLMRLLEKNPADRFQRAADAGWALMMIAEGAKKRSRSIASDEAPTRLPELKPPRKTDPFLPKPIVLDRADPIFEADHPTLLARPLSKMEPKAEAVAQTELQVPLIDVEHETIRAIERRREPPEAPNTHDLATIVRAARGAGTLPWVQEDGFLPRGSTPLPIAAGSPIPSLDNDTRPTPYPRRVPPLPKTWRRATPPGPSMQLVGAGLGLYGLRAIPLVGRAEERDAIWRALQAVRETRQPRLVFLSGAAGNGKSRIVEWMSQRADEVGNAILMKAVHGPHPSPNDGLGRMMSRHLRTTELPRTEMGERTEKILRRLGISDPIEWSALTELMSPSPSTPNLIAGGTTAIRFHTPGERHALIRRVIARYAEERPVIVWLEDVHWGADALAFADHVLDHAATDPCPVLLLATVREEALAERKTESEMIAELLESSFASKVTVSPLPEPDQEKLVRELLLLDDALANEVVRRTGGNPLFAVQLVGDFVSRGVLDVGERGFVLKSGEGLVLPDDIHQVWSLRIARVLAEQNEDARARLELAAVLGRDVDRGEWEAAAKLEGLERAPRLLAALIGDRLAQNVEGGFSFSHGMLRESLERSAREAGRFERHHLACAEMLEQRYGAQAPGIAERLGIHRMSAGDLQAAVEPLLRGATERMKTSDYREALGLLLRRERALTKLPADEEDPRWGEGWVLRAHVCNLQGDLQEAQLWAEKAHMQGVRWGWRKVLPDALAELATVAYERGDQIRAIELFSQASELYAWNKDELGIARASYGIGDAIYRRGELDGAEEQYRRSLELYEAHDDAQGMATALWGLGYVALWRGELHLAKTAFERQLRLCEALGDRYRVARSVGALGEVARQAGQLELAEAHYRRALAIDEAIASSKAWVGMMNLGLTLIARREMVEARKIIQQVIDGFGEGGEPNQLAVVHAQILPTLRETDERPLWDEHFARASELIRRTELCDGDIAWVVERAGDEMMGMGDPVRARHAYELALSQWKGLARADQVAAVEAKIDDIAAARQR